MYLRRYTSPEVRTYVPWLRYVRLPAEVRSYLNWGLAVPIFFARLSTLIGPGANDRPFANMAACSHRGTSPAVRPLRYVRPLMRYILELGTIVCKKNLKHN
jgi:hypothetical protein